MPDSPWRRVADENEQARVFTAIVLIIAAEGGVVPRALCRVAPDRAFEAGRFFEERVAAGIEADVEGHIFGAALTTKESPHRIRIAERDLFAWCALDTLFIPGLRGGGPVKPNRRVP